MITCPWCGTHYIKFRPNCKNCGGPLPPPPPTEATTAPAAAPVADLTAPPPPPRAFKETLVWKKLGSDGWAIAALTFLILGIVFTVTGVPLIFAFLIGIPFVLLGLAFLGAGIALGVWRYQQAKQMVEILRTGQAVLGTIVEVAQNYHVEVNGRNPWTISYRFQVRDREYEGEATTLRPLGFTHREGQSVYVLYLESDPAQNTIYPPVV